MNLRTTETRLAKFTLAMLVVYFPLETWVSLPDGLTNPFYLVDLIAMALLPYGALRSLRARPRSAPGVLCAAYGWTAANGWRATFDGVFELRDGGELEHGAPAGHGHPPESRPIPCEALPRRVAEY
ncbi:MAG: hypothetical protein LC804_12475 [Acidobacteria bacterium]|nr:hypothetical protein [Acidobacteriota bacterium]